MANFQITSTDKWKRSAVIADRGKIARGKESANRNEPKLQKEYSNSVGRPDNRSAVVRTASAHFARFIFSFLHLFRSFAACHFSSFRFTSFRFISVHFHFMSYSCVHSFIISIISSCSCQCQFHFNVISLSCQCHVHFTSVSFQVIHSNSFQMLFRTFISFILISCSSHGRFSPVQVHAHSHTHVNSIQFLCSFHVHFICFS